jgi:hypothetical protein
VTDNMKGSTLTFSRECVVSIPTYNFDCSFSGTGCSLGRAKSRLNYTLLSKMRKQTVVVITTLALIVYFIITLSPVSANQMVVNVFLRNQLPIPVSSITITHFVPVDVYAQVSYVQSGTMPPSDFQWYVNGEPTKFESASNSVYTFTPQAIGKYVITVTVNGETNSELVTVSVIPEQSSFNFVTPWVWESPPKLIIESPINETTYTGRAFY